MEEIKISKEEVRALMPKRDGHKNKGSFGKVLVIAGNDEISGAAYLTALGAYKIGAGLVKVFTHEKNSNVIRTLLPEALVSVYNDLEADERVLNNNILWADVVVAGPGIGTRKNARKIVEAIRKIKDLPVILDADALNVLSLEGDMTLGENFIVTPHLKEMERLLDGEISVSEMVENKEKFDEAIRKFSEKSNATLVLKDCETSVKSKDMDLIYRNKTGNSALSKGGTGDILAGMIAGLAAQYTQLQENNVIADEGLLSVNPSLKALNENIILKSAIFGVFLHGDAADNFAKHHKSYKMLASDIVDYIDEE